MTNSGRFNAENPRIYSGPLTCRLIAVTACLAIGISVLPIVPSSQSLKPLSAGSIETLLKGGVSLRRITTLVHELHVDFQLTPELGKQFRALGANDELMETVKKYYQPSTSSPIAPRLTTPAEMAIQHYRQGEAYYAESKWDEAIREYQTAIKLKPDDAAAYGALGFALVAKGDIDGAIAEFREALRLKPADADLHSDLGAALYKKGDVDGAIAEYRKGLGLNPSNASLHNDLAAALFKKGDLGGAIKECGQALQLAPNNYEAHRNLGEALNAMGDEDGAIREYQEAVRLAPNDAESYDDLGIALGEKSDWQAAESAFQKAIQLKPDWVDTHLALAKAFQAGRSDIFALAEYLQVLRLRPGDGAASTQAGTILDEEGCWKEAVKQFQTAVTSEPNQASVHALLGLALYRAGDLRGSAQQYEMASRLDTNNRVFRKSFKKVSNEFKKHGTVRPDFKSAESSSCKDSTNFATLLPVIEGRPRPPQKLAPTGAEQARNGREASLTGGGMKPGEQAYGVGGNVTEPIALYEPDPPYSKQARRAKLQGTVVLAIIIDAKGNVRDVQVLHFLGMGLDEEAVRTVRTWKFKPATRNGVPVPVRVTVEIAFKLF